MSRTKKKDVSRFSSNSPTTSTSIVKSPAFLLLVTGTLVGFNFPLGKMAGDVGIPPVFWAMIVSLGACGFLLPMLVFKRRLKLPKRNMLRYIIITALISFVIPNLLLYSVIPHAGAGYTGLMFALSPVFTLTLAVLFRLQKPGRKGLMGITLGLVGAAIVSLSRGGTSDAPPLVWLLVALLLPLALACGNVYRSLDWPEGASPDLLAFWSHAFSVILFLCLFLASEAPIPVNALREIPYAALAQMLIAGLTFPVYFRLQQSGGPVLLSQIGYVAAAVGLVTATVLLGEQYGTMTWLGAAVIGCGIILTVVTQMKQRFSTLKDDSGRSLPGVLAHSGQS